MGIGIATRYLYLAGPACATTPAASSTCLANQLLLVNNTNILPTYYPAYLSYQRRHAGWFGWGKSKSKQAETAQTAEQTNIPGSRYLRELLLKGSPKAAGAGNSLLPTYLPERGTLSSDSIFEEEGGEGPSEEAAAAKAPTEPALPGEPVYIHSDYLKVVDPNRDKSWSWSRRFEARIHRRRGRLTKKEALLQSEKSLTAKSHFIKTSVKKLAPLARQISGLKLNDAIVQMRFSPKKASTEVLEHLMHARNKALVRRGMNMDEMYVDQAWVGRGAYEKEQNHRARGRVDILRKPYTSITVVLKEEVTRQRIAKEKEEKRLRQKVWVQLPDRPIYGQRQYYQW